MTGSKPDPKEPVVEWDEFEHASDLIVADRRDPDEDQP